MEPVLNFIREQNVHDGELTVYSGYLVGVYRDLDVRPSTRFVLLDVEARVFPSHVDEMEAALEKLGNDAGSVGAQGKAFYEGKVAAAQFFAQTNLPRISAEVAIAQATDLSVMDLPEDAF